MSTNLPERLVVEEDRVIMRGGLAASAILDVGYSGEPGWDEFTALFDVVRGPGGNWLAAEDYYQGLTSMALIRRKSDERLFGYIYWDDISKHGDTHYESNGDSHGFEMEWDEELSEADLMSVYVWLPVEPFTITGYRFPETTGEVAA